jgi:hypothetical protein
MENLEEKMSIASFRSEEDVENPKEKVSRAITLSLNSSHKKVFECWILRFLSLIITYDLI